MLSLLYWGMRTMGVTVAYTAWFSRRIRYCPRYTMALRICSGISFVLSDLWQPWPIELLNKN